MSQQSKSQNRLRHIFRYGLIIIIVCLVIVTTVLYNATVTKPNRGGFASPNAYAAEITEGEPYTTVAWTDMVYTEIIFVAVSPDQAFTAQDHEFVVLHVRTKPHATQAKTTITARYGFMQAIHSQDPNLTERIDRAFQDAQERGHTKRVDVYLYIDQPQN